MGIHIIVPMNPTPSVSGVADAPTDTLAFAVLKQFRLIYGSVKQHFREVENSCGVSGSQLWLLHEIAHTPGVGVSALAERLSIHQSTCSQLVDKLETRGLVSKQRRPDDQRRVGLQLSDKATAVLAAALMAFSRVYIAAHYPLDVAAGLLLAYSVYSPGSSGARPT